jgi:hypothetical protein
MEKLSKSDPLLLGFLDPFRFITDPVDLVLPFFKHFYLFLALLPLF